MNTPTPEAVEAAMRMFANTPWNPGEWSHVHPLLETHREHKNNEPDYIAGRILAAEVDRLREALERIVKNQPCYDGGGCFYPMHDGNGEYIGEQNVDPLNVIQGMTEIARAALNQNNAQ